MGLRRTLAIATAGVALALAAPAQALERLDGYYGGPEGFSGSVTGPVSVSPDLRYVAFSSTSDDLDYNGDNDSADAFVFDRLVGIYQLSLSDDGSSLPGDSTDVFVADEDYYTAFTSKAALTGDDVPEAADGSRLAQVFTRRFSDTLLASASSDGEPANAASRAVGISADGRTVAFASAASNLTPGDVNGRPDLFVRDIRTGVTRNVSRGAIDGGGALSADGSTVAYVTYGTLWTRDLATGVETRIADTGSRIPDVALSRDGRVVAFPSGTASLRVRGPGDAGATIARGGLPLSQPALSPDGKRVAYVVTSGTGTQIRVRDLAAGADRLVSADASGAPLAGTFEHPAVAGRGNAVVFAGGERGLLLDLPGAPLVEPILTALQAGIATLPTPIPAADPYVRYYLAERLRYAQGSAGTASADTCRGLRIFGDQVEFFTGAGLISAQQGAFFDAVSAYLGELLACPAD